MIELFLEKVTIILTISTRDLAKPGVMIFFEKMNLFSLTILL